MARTPESNTQFVLAAIQKMADVVQSLEIASPYSFVVTRNQLPTVTVGVISVAPHVERHHVKQVLAIDDTIDFLTNIPKASIWTGEAIHEVKSNNFAFGSMKNLMSSLREENVRDWIDAESSFFQRVLRQHNAVVSFTQIADRNYLITRKTGPQLRAVILNEYELSAQTVREAKDIYGDFEIIVATNPNVGPTEEAKRIAPTLNIEQHVLRTFLGRLNSP